MTQIKALPLTAAGFAAFGQVFEAAGGAAGANQGRAERFDMPLELASADDRANRLCTAIYRIRKSTLPFAVSMVERHSLSPQLFYPNSGDRFLVCACPVLDGGEPDLTALRAFIGRRAQGIVWRAGTWHSPLAAIGADGDFLMQMWQCDGPLDCEERALSMPINIAD